MFEEEIAFYNINNIQPTPLYDLSHWFFMFSSAIFLALFIWSLVLFAREKKQNPSSRKYLPRVLGFFFALLLAVLGLTLAIQWYTWFS